MKLIDIVNAALLALRRFGPYALLELLLPGGTILAVLLYLYRRRSGDRACEPLEAFGSGGSRWIARLWGTQRSAGVGQF